MRTARLPTVPALVTKCQYGGFQVNKFEWFPLDVTSRGLGLELWLGVQSLMYWRGQGQGLPCLMSRGGGARAGASGPTRCH